jgi:hypothetical protein
MLVHIHYLTSRLKTSTSLGSYQFNLFLIFDLGLTEMLSCNYNERYRNLYLSAEHLYVFYIKYHTFKYVIYSVCVYIYIYSM